MPIVSEGALDSELGPGESYYVFMVDSPNVKFRFGTFIGTSPCDVADIPLVSVLPPGTPVSVCPVSLDKYIEVNRMVDEAALEEAAAYDHVAE